MNWNFDGSPTRDRYAFRERPVEDDSDSTALRQVMDILLRLLPKFPDARDAVLQAFRAAFIPTPEAVPDLAT